MLNTKLEAPNKYENRKHKQRVPAELGRRTYSFTSTVVEFTRTLPDSDFFWVISEQILASITSAGAHIVEAEKTANKCDFIKLFESSLKNISELKYWLFFLRDSGRLEDPISVAPLINESRELSNILVATVINTRNGKD